jgi:glycolate oxidase FAD binding subunit
MSPTAIEASEEFQPATPAELSRFLAENSAGAQKPVYPVGGRTALNYGHLPSQNGIAVSLAGLSKQIDYPNRDMTITLEAGMRVETLNKILKDQNQRLPIDIAQAHRATIGGAIATNASGPHRYFHGTLRDYVIGIEAVTADGTVFHAGGRVVKNVAGYDLCKLMVGSLGTLGIITSVTLKVRPCTETTSLIWATYDNFSEVDAVLENLLVSEARPVFLEVFNGKAAHQIIGESRINLPEDKPVLCLGIEGTEAEVGWQVKQLKREISSIGPDELTVLENDDATKLTSTIQEYQTSSDDPISFQANLLPSHTMDFVQLATEFHVAVQSHAGNGIVLGHLPDDASTPEQAEALLAPLREKATSGQGNLTVLNCEDHLKDQLFHYEDSTPEWNLMKRLKTQLDPHNILNPGRLFPVKADSAT